LALIPGSRLGPYEDHDPKGDRILGFVDAASADQTVVGPTPPIEVVLGWFEELKRLVPVK
jgi:hypothetical protein